MSSLGGKREFWLCAICCAVMRGKGGWCEECQLFYRKCRALFPNEGRKPPRPAEIEGRLLRYTARAAAGLDLFSLDSEAAAG